MFLNKTVSSTDEATGSSQGSMRSALIGVGIGAGLVIVCLLVVVVKLSMKQNQRGGPIVENVPAGKFQSDF